MIYDLSFTSPDESIIIQRGSIRKAQLHIKPPK